MKNDFNKCESHKMLQKYPMNVCGMRDGPSGDMLASGRHNLIEYVIILGFLNSNCQINSKQ